MIDVGPVPRFADAKGDIEHPIVRDMDTNMYERQHGNGLEIGSYAHRAILHDPEELPSVEEAQLSPTEFPFTAEDFELQYEQALELMPEIVGDETVGQKYAINGLLSLTPDGMPLLGETPEVKNLWSVSAVWIKEGPGIGKAVSEWMVLGESEIDLQASDIARFYDHQKTRKNIKERTAEGFNKTYGIVHPNEQWASNRNVRLSPYYERQKALGAEFYETVGWERPFWYESNAGLVEKFGDAVMPRTAEWESRWWSPIINAEHLQMRETAGLVDLTAFVEFDIQGPGALATVQKVCMRQMDVPIGRVVYTPVLSANGGFKSDLTVMRLAHDHFRVVTGGAHGMADLKWFRDHLPEDGTAQITDLTSSLTTLGIWGPNARRILESITRDDVSHEGFRFGTCKTIEIGSLKVLASRISYVGDLGWELYVPMEQGAQLWDALWEAGQDARPDPGRHRRLRHDRPHREGLPRLRHRARDRVHRRRGRDGSSQGQGGRLHRQGVAPQAPQRGPRSHVVLADGRRPHQQHRREALHDGQGADSHHRQAADHRRARAPVVRHQRRVGTVGRQARADELPAAAVREGGHQAHRRVPR